MEAIPLVPTPSTTTSNTTIPDSTITSIQQQHQQTTRQNVNNANSFTSSDEDDINRVNTTNRYYASSSCSNFTHRLRILNRRCLNINKTCIKYNNNHDYNLIEQSIEFDDFVDIDDDDNSKKNCCCLCFCCCQLFNKFFTMCFK